MEKENDYESYLERYCKSHNLTPEEAEKHKLVQEVKQYYERVQAGKVI